MGLEQEFESWPQAVVFDLDGTIADTAADIQQALNQALETQHLAPIDIDTVKTMIGAGPEVLVRRALATGSAGTSEPLVRTVTDAFHHFYDRNGNALSRLFEDVRPCLEALEARGIRMGICSNKPEPFCAVLLRDLGALDYFPAIQGYGSGLPPKPAPEPLLAAFDKLGVTPEQALYVGDSETDVLTARAAGVAVALVSHGYTVTPVAELDADWVLRSLADLPTIFRRAKLA